MPRQFIPVHQILPLEKVKRSDLSVVPCPRREVYPHYVLRMRNVPGLGDLDAVGFCHSQKNQLHGVGLNEVGVKGIMDRVNPEWFWLVGRYFEDADALLNAAGQFDPDARAIPGYLVRSSEITAYMLYAPKRKVKRSTLPLERKFKRSCLTKVTFADPEDFSLTPTVI